MSLLKKLWEPEVIRINISSTFVPRTICKECGQAPDEYYWVRHSLHFLDPRSNHAVFFWFKKYIKNIIGFWYKRYEPRHFYSMKTFNLHWTEKSYKPTLHQHRFINPEDNITEYLSCPCGKSVWAFSQKIADKRPEIRNRKGRYKYPKKFESF